MNRPMHGWFTSRTWLPAAHAKNNALGCMGATRNDPIEERFRKHPLKGLVQNALPSSQDFDVHPHKNSKAGLAFDPRHLVSSLVQESPLRKR